MVLAMDDARSLTPESGMRTIGQALEAEQLVGESDNPQTDLVDIFQKLIEALPEQIALVDEHWEILAVNPAWTKTAALYGYDALRPGTNYAAFCKDRMDEGHGAARQAVEGIKVIDAKLSDSFHYLYDGNDRWEGHTFSLEINRLSIAGRTFATITRYDVTEIVQLRRMREAHSTSLIEGQAQERRRIARDLHDSAQQMLVGVSLGLGRLKRTSEMSQFQPVLDELQQIVSDVQREIRSIAYMAHPPALENLGLRRALEELVMGYGRRTGLATSFHSEGDFGVWSAAETAVYRVVQEALTNVHRHAHASKINVGLFRRKSMIHAAVIDDGIGMPANVPAGVGVAGMKARLVELGGRLLVRSHPTGTAIIASVPTRPRRWQLETGPLMSSVNLRASVEGA